MSSTKKLKTETAIEEKVEKEAQLSIDVYETEDNFVIQSTIAGVKAEDLDISIEDDLVTIRGARQHQEESTGKNYFYQECYWGGFSRQVILPEEVEGSLAQAKVKDGILTLTIPKSKRTQKKKRKISIKQEE
jgi:HSP20 family protein